MEAGHAIIAEAGILLGIDDGRSEFGFLEAGNTGVSEAGPLLGLDEGKSEFG